MKLRQGESASQVYERTLRKQNPSKSLEAVSLAESIGKHLSSLTGQSGFRSLSSVQRAVQSITSLYGVNLKSSIAGWIQPGRSKQFILETSEPFLMISVEVRHGNYGDYTINGAAAFTMTRPVSKRFSGAVFSRRNPEGDYEDHMAKFIEQHIAPMMTGGSNIAIPVYDGYLIRLICVDDYGSRSYIIRLEKETRRQDEMGTVIEHVTVEEDRAHELGVLTEIIHGLLHRTLEVPRQPNPLPVKWRSRLRSRPRIRRSNRSDDPPTELPGHEIDAGVGDPMPDIIDDPAESDKRYEEFHGAESEEEILAEEELQVREHLGVLGRLIQIVCESVTGSYKINFGEDVLLCVSSDGKQLYIVGGDQSLDLESMGFSEEQRNKDKVFIGSAQQITYRTRKHFDQFAEIDYVHDFGEDGGTLPALVYDRLNLTIELAGGDYEIKQEGIVN